MSLYYGYDTKPSQTQTRLLHYNFAYSSISTTYRFPSELKTGHPISFMYGGNIEPDTKFTILSHTFDDDDVITKLSLKYMLVGTKMYGNTVVADLYETDMMPKKISNENKFNLNKTFVLSEVTRHYDKILLFCVKFKRTSNVSYGNESNLDIVVEF